LIPRLSLLNRRVTTASDMWLLKGLSTGFNDTTAHLSWMHINCQ
jgi:hypothetical protein